MSQPSQDVVLFHLPGSRAIRIAWLLEELHVPYKVEQSPRGPGFGAPSEFRERVGGLGNVPTVHDGDVIVQESGAIAEYLIEQHGDLDAGQPLLPTTRKSRSKVREYMYLAEGTFMLHIAPRLNTRKASADLFKNSDFQAFIDATLEKTRQDVTWLEAELAAQRQLHKHSVACYLVDNHLTAADIMMAFGVDLIMNRIIGGDWTKTYPHIGEWMATVTGRAAYRRAKERCS